MAAPPPDQGANAANFQFLAASGFHLGVPVGLPLPGLQQNVAGLQYLLAPAPGLPGAPHLARTPGPPGPPPTPSPPHSGNSGASGASGHAEPPQAKADAAEKIRTCHLHKKPSRTCKVCQRVQEQNKAIEASSDQNAKPPAQNVGKIVIKPTSESKPTFQCSNILKDQILKSSYFKTLMHVKTTEYLMEEIVNFADSLDIYQAGSATTPSAFICCVYRLFTLEVTDDELRDLLDHRTSPAVRCVGFLCLRFSERPEVWWDIFEEYILDEMDISSLTQLNVQTSVQLPANVGEYVESLLMREKYFGTPLPRIPAAIRRKLEEELAPVPQYRKRANANKRALKLFREKGTPVEVNRDSRWFNGVVLEFDGRRPSRLKLHVRLDGDRDVSVHIGKAVLRGASRGGDSRGSRSPDWSRYKGKSDAKMVQELRQSLRDEAVCANSREVIRRPVGFEAGLAVKREHGYAESFLLQDDTWGNTSTGKRKRTSQEHEEERERPTNRRTPEEEHEWQKKMQQIYEKYGQGGPSTGGTDAVRDVEGPDVMRLG